MFNKNKKQKEIRSANKPSRDKPNPDDKKNANEDASDNKGNREQKSNMSSEGGRN